MAADWSGTSPRELVRAFLMCDSIHTARAYGADLTSLGHFLRSIGEPVNRHADTAECICEMPRGAARRTADEYKSWLKSQGKSVNTIRRKIGSMLGLLRKAHEYDVIDWAIKVRLPSPQPVRGTTGPSRRQVDDMFDVCKRRGDEKGIRDAAMLSLLFYSALRSNEVITLDVANVALDLKEIEILGKGLWERTRLPVAKVTVRAIRRWLDVRGDESGPLFTSQARWADGDERLSYAGLYATVMDIGRRADIERVTPHGLRHAAATELDRLTDGNIHFGMALTRHKKPETLLIYQDKQQNLTRDATELLAAGFPVFRR